MKHTVLWMFCLLLTLAAAVSAQNETACPAIAQQALETVDTYCALTGRNEACYGFSSLNATPNDAASDFKFTTPGDTTTISVVQSIQLYPMDMSAGTWGVALLRLQANIPNTLPGQNVTILLFGDVAFEPANPANTLSVTARSGINVRSGPGTNYPVVTTLAAGAVVQAQARNTAGDWLLVNLPDKGSVWVFANLVIADGDAAGLDVVADDAVSAQAFYFRSGLGNAPCAAVPESGLLLHTPAGVGKVELLINEVRFVVGSTVYIQAIPGGKMVVSVIEGEVSVFTGGVSVTVKAGESVRIPLDSAGRPTGAPSQPAPFEPDSIEPLPITLISRDTGYVGTWHSIDVDGSSQRLRIWLVDGVYQVEWYDDGASVCGIDSAGTPLYAVTLTGSARVLDTGGLVMTVKGICANAANTAVGPFVVPLNYDTTNDTIYDGTLTWNRASP